MLGQKDVQRREALRLDDIVQRGLFKFSDHSIAVDGGAHVGSWTDRMLRHFHEVHAFEPCRESYDLLVENCPQAHCYNQALMDKRCRVNVAPPRPKRRTLTARQVNPSRTGDIEAISIDILDLPGCDLIKLDLEGCEYQGLVGAKETIRKYHPFLVVEFNGLCTRFGYNDTDIASFIRSMGYREVWRDGVDRGFRWIEK